MSSGLGALVYNVLIVATIWFGAFISLWGHGKGQHVRTMISFSAGIFLGVAFLHMIPESIRLLGESAGFYVLGGFVGVYILERFIMLHPCEENQCDYHQVGLAAFLGLSTHSIMNGFALGSSMLIPGLGFTVFLATLIHKAPESFSLTSILIMGKQQRSAIYRYIALLSVMVPLGTSLAFLGLEAFGKKSIGVAVAISAGTFLHIATGDLLPETHVGTRRAFPLIGFLLGLALAVLTRFLDVA